MSVTLSSLPGKCKCSLLNFFFFFCPDGITPNSGLTGPKNTNIYIYIYINVYIYISKVATIVEGDPKAPFSIATTPRCRGGRYSIPWIAPLYP